MEATSFPKARDGLESIKRPDGQALFNPETENVFALDATSMAIWEACDGRTTVEELIAAVGDLGGMDSDMSTRVVAMALGELEAAGLISMD
jgi:hypothetical protein